MISIENKLNLFTKLVVDQLQDKYDKKVAELEQENELKLREFKLDVSSRSEVIYDQYVDRAVSEKKIRLSRVRSECKKNRLRKQQELTDHLVDEVMNKGRHFVKSDDYLAYLDRLIKNHIIQIKGYNQFDVYITSRDYDHHLEEIHKLMMANGFEKNRFEVKVSDQDMVGGFSIVHKALIRKLDLTLRSRIEENRSVMGNAVYKMLKEAGE